MADRMLHVIVVTGIGLVASACGGAAESASDAGFPSELPVRIEDASGDSSDAADATDAFPGEGPMPLDSGVDAGGDAEGLRDAEEDVGFPSELPH